MIDTRSSGLDYYNVCEFVVNKVVGEVHFYLYNQMPVIDKEKPTGKKFSGVENTDAYHYVVPYSMFLELAGSMNNVADAMNNTVKVPVEENVKSGESDAREAVD